jgi:hypothetical protein
MNNIWTKRDSEYVYHLHDTPRHYISVILGEQHIRFFKNNTTLSSSYFPKGEPIHAISLLSPKETGNAILGISCITNDILKILDENRNELDIEINHSYCPDFPIEKNNIFQIAFLDFVCELEQENSLFANEPAFKSTKEKLHKSTVYKLLTAKLAYHQYVIGSRIPKDSYAYNHCVTQYADLLMSPKLSSIFPPDKVGKGCLFENPEYELQRIMLKNTCIRKSKYNKHRLWVLPLFAKVAALCYFYLDKYWGAKLFPPVIMALSLLIEPVSKKKKRDIYINIRKKIQNFFFQKHSTTVAYYTWTGKILYWFTWMSMAVWSILFVCECLSENSKFGLIYSGIGIIILFVINAGANKNSNSFFPRIIVAVIASWMLIGISDDFVASQINISVSKTITTIIVCLVIVVLVLLKESKEHSPYYLIFSFKECNFKILPILSFSLFMSIFIGIIVQLATFQSLIRTNNVLPSVEFSANFAAMEHHKTHTQLLINNLEAYKSELQHNRIRNEESDVRRCASLDSLGFLISKDSVFFRHKQLLVNITNHATIAKHRIKSIDSLSFHIHNNIVSLNHFSVTYCNTDSLLKIVCQTDSFKFQGNDNLIYEQFFKRDMKENKKDIVCVQIELPCDKKPYYLFPRTLIFHSFIVLLIAFVVQIIVSGKTVTEGL